MIENCLGIYLGFVFAVTMLTFTRCSLEAVLSCQGAQSLHDNVARRVIQAPSSWYDATPIGRIVNRLSQDIGTIVSV